ncbi:hypothetical protein Taro_024810 [Colocasia esculenta]|uniref:Retrotransposon gag domain-containing protein n=1 Tax=Colocasia esculenta TaxID=4460 RepID=A0A843VLG7_COLES|nr:hypothetical protein [Colocasia esculenta]
MCCVPLCLHGLWFGIPCEASARSREADSDQVRYQFNGLGRGDPSQLKISEMADRRDWGGGGDDPEESTQRMIERIWESLMDIRARMDQQAPVPPIAVPPGDGEAIPVAPVPPRVEVPFVVPVPPPMLIAEEPVMQVEKFLRLQPPTYLGGPNPDTAEHWVHEIERVFATMRCPVADRVVLAAYQLRGFALEWWRLKMQTTFAGRTEEVITWTEFLDVSLVDLSLALLLLPLLELVHAGIHAEVWNNPLSYARCSHTSSTSPPYSNILYHHVPFPNEDTPSGHSGSAEKVPDDCRLPLDAAVTGTPPSSSPASGMELQASSAKPSSPRDTAPSCHGCAPERTWLRRVSRTCPKPPLQHHP